MNDQRCANCGCALPATTSTCAACGVVGTSAAPLGARRFEAGPAPLGSYDIPLGASEAVSWTFKLWSENLARLAVLGFIPYALMIPMMGLGLFFAFTDASFDGGAWWSDDTMWPLLIAGATGAGALFVVLAVASIGACIHVVDEKTQGGDMSAPAALLASLKHVGWLICGYVVLFVAWAAALAAPLTPIVIGVAESDALIGALALPGLLVTALAFFVCVRLLPMLPVIVVEDANVFTAVARSWSLTSGRTGPVALAALLFGLAFMGISIATSMLGIIPILGAIVQMGVNAVLMPLAYVFPFVIYAACVRASTSRGPVGGHAAR